MIISIPRKVLHIYHALYAVGERDQIVIWFRRAFLECDLKLHKDDESRLIHFPGGIADRLISAYVNACDLSPSFGEEKSVQPNSYQVRFLSSGNQNVTGIALKIHFKIGPFQNAERHKGRATKFLNAVLRISRELGITLIEFDDWHAVVARRPELKADCDWPDGFLYIASEKIRAYCIAKKDERQGQK